MNLEERKIALLKRIKEERKYIIISTDKNLGPAIMEIDYSIQRYLADHLDDTNTYKETTKMDARILNEENFRLICTYFIDDAKATITNQAQTFFMREYIGFTDTMIVH